MRFKGLLIVGIMVALFMGSGLTTFAGESTNVKRVTTEELQNLLEDPSTIVLDARIVKDWRKSDLMIKGAHRVDPHDVSSWASQYPSDARIVLYCA